MGQFFLQQLEKDKENWQWDVSLPLNQYPFPRGDLFFDSGFDLTDSGEFLPQQVRTEFDEHIFADEGNGPYGDIPDGRISIYLIKKGIPFNKVDNHGSTALDIAGNGQSGAKNHPQVFDLLTCLNAKRACDLSEQEWIENTPFTVICAQGSLNRVKEYIRMFGISQIELKQSTEAILGYSYFGLLPKTNDAISHEKVFDYLFELNQEQKNREETASQLNDSFILYVSSLIKNLKSWSHQSWVLQQNWLQKQSKFLEENKHFESHELPRIYFPEIDIEKIMAVLQKNNCKINAIDFRNLTALDFVIQEKRQLEEKMNVFKNSYKEDDFLSLKRFYPITFNAQMEIRKLEIQRNLFISENLFKAERFLRSHQAKTYADLQNGE